MPEGPRLWLFVPLALLIVCSAFFSAVETAYTSLNHARLQMRAKKSRCARIALKLSDKFDKILSTLLIGNNIVNISAATLSTLIFADLIGEEKGAAVSTIVLTIVLLIFGEITPKGIAKERPETVVTWMAYPTYFFYILFMPVNFLFEQWKKLMRIIFRLNKPQPTLTEDELHLIVTDIKNEGVIDQEEHDLIQKSMRFDDTFVKQVMMPFSSAVTIKKGQTIEEIKNMFEDNNYSRVPYLDPETEEVLGIIYQKDFYEMLLEKDCSFDSIVKKAIFTRTNTPLDDLFKRMQKLHQHLAIVRDPSKKVVGIITMEDMIEELVGEIEDEYDDE